MRTLSDRKPPHHPNRPARTHRLPLPPENAASLLTRSTNHAAPGQPRLRRSYTDLQPFTGGSPAPAWLHGSTPAFPVALHEHAPVVVDRDRCPDKAVPGRANASSQNHLFSLAGRCPCARLVTGQPGPYRGVFCFAAGVPYGIGTLTQRAAGDPPAGPCTPSRRYRSMKGEERQETRSGPGRSILRMSGSIGMATASYTGG